MSQQPTSNSSDRPRVDRRAAFGIWASGLASLTSACGSRDVTTIDTPEGKVLQLEKDDLYVLVSGVKPTYHLGDFIDVHVIVNNQSSRYATARIRTKLIGRGQQVVSEAEVVQINVKPSDATRTDRSLLIPNNLSPGEYTLQVELPPWSFEGRQTGGASLNTSINVVA
jgi:hypothetical protein